MSAEQQRRVPSGYRRAVRHRGRFGANSVYTEGDVVQVVQVPVISTV